MHNYNYEIVNDSIDLKLFNEKLEKYRPLYEESEDSYYGLCDSFCLSKYSTADDYARIASFLLYNKNSALIETLSWKLSVLFAIFPDKFSVLDTYAKSLSKEDYIMLRRNLYDCIDGFYCINYSDSKKKRRQIINKYYPYLSDIKPTLDCD